MARHKFGYGWRNVNRKPQKLVSFRFDTEDLGWKPVPRTLPELITAINLIVEANHLTDWEIGMESEYGTIGDSDHDRFAVTGWRDATKEEIEEARERLDRSKESASHYLDNAERMLRAQRPELFKEPS